MTRVRIKVLALGLAIAAGAGSHTFAQDERPAAAEAAADEEQLDCPNLTACVRLLVEHQVDLPAAGSRPGSPLGSPLGPRPGLPPGPALGPAAPRPPAAGPATPAPDSLSQVYQRLKSFGDPAVTAILPLLQNANPVVSRRARAAIDYFPVIAPRHAPALIAAASAGTPGLGLAISKTGTEDALKFLWGTFQTGDAAAAIDPLSRFGQRAWPLIRAEMERCRDGESTPQRCRALGPLISGQTTSPVFAVPMWEAIARSERAQQEVRDAAADRLIALRHPYGAEILVQRLQGRIAAASDQAASSQANSDQAARNRADAALVTLMEQISRYGAVGVKAGPLITPLIERRDLPRARLAAALSVGRIGYRPGAAVLLAQQAEFTENWALAYNAAEGLGRLRAGEAVLKGLARDHWYAPVRNNARRGLNFIAAGRFTLPALQTEPEDAERAAGSVVRYTADISGNSGWSNCSALRSAKYPQLNPVLLWPGREAGLVRITLSDPERADVDPVLTRYPAYRPPGQRPPVLMTTLGAWTVVGTNTLTTGGDVTLLGPNGEVRRVSADRAIAVFPADDALLVFTGPADGSGAGGLLILALDASGAPQVRRSIALPDKPWNFRLAYPRSVVFSTGGQNITVNTAGVISDAGTLAACKTGL